MHSPVLQVPGTGQLRAFPVPFWCHFTATASYHSLLPVNSLIRAGQVNLVPARAPAWAAPVPKYVVHYVENTLANQLATSPSWEIRRL